MTDLISASEIAVLNAARTVLQELDERASKASIEVEKNHTAHSLGRVSEAANSAEYAVFMVLNTASNFGGANLTDAQVHNH